MLVREAADQFTGQYLPVLSKGREGVVAKLCEALNCMLDKERQKAEGVELIWRPCSFCPSDAVSLLSRRTGANRWYETPGMMFFWDTERGCITSVLATPKLEQMDAAFPVERGHEEERSAP